MKLKEHIELGKALRQTRENLQKIQVKLTPTCRCKSRLVKAIDNIDKTRSDFEKIAALELGDQFNLNIYYGKCNREEE